MWSFGFPKRVSSVEHSRAIEANIVPFWWRTGLPRMTDYAWIRTGISGSWQHQNRLWWQWRSSNGCRVKAFMVSTTLSLINMYWGMTSPRIPSNDSLVQLSADFSTRKIDDTWHMSPKRRNAIRSNLMTYWHCDSETSQSGAFISDNRMRFILPLRYLLFYFTKFCIK